MDDEEDSLTVDYQFGMELDGAEMPQMVNWSLAPTVIYPPFMAKDEVKDMEDDGPYVIELREAIPGKHSQLGDARMAARDDVERMMEDVDISNTWLMENVSILHCCGDRLQESLGDIATLMT